MDQFDRASELEQAHRDAALATARCRLTGQPSAQECEDCGEAIPQARQDASPGCTRCLSCQQDHELYLLERR